MEWWGEWPKTIKTVTQNSRGNGIWQFWRFSVSTLWLFDSFDNSDNFLSYVSMWTLHILKIFFSEWKQENVLQMLWTNSIPVGRSLLIKAIYNEQWTDERTALPSWNDGTQLHFYSENVKAIDSFIWRIESLVHYLQVLWIHIVPLHEKCFHLGIAQCMELSFLSRISEKNVFYRFCMSAYL